MANEQAFKVDEYPVIVGMDFGTTFSGCCYAFAQNEEVIDITKWPKQNNNVYPKTPTLSLYKRGSKDLVDWGHGARRQAFRPGNSDHILLSKFKLYLDENLDLPPLANGLGVVDVIADYLRVFHGHVVNELQKGFATNYDVTKFRYCLTVPAMWSDRAKAIMREAAIRANMIMASDHPDRLMLISEPEAAALYCEKKSEQFNLKHGERFMICDAGGGTVDLIVFEIDQVAGGGRTLKEVTKGHGGSCGSGFLDEKMRALLQKKFRYHVGNIPESAFETIMDNFVDLIKPEFDGFEDHFLQLPAAMGLGDLTDEEIGLENGVLHLPAEELRNEVFEPVIQQVLDLIEGQLTQSSRLEAIFLVGGFGQSNYLFRRVEETFSQRVGMIGVPPRGELAVVRGAVYFGLNPQIVTERVSRRTYGVETRMLYQPGLDPIEYSVVGADGRLFCRQRFSVYVHRGQRIRVDECVSKNFVISYPNDTDSDLYAFDNDGPAPRLTTHPSIKKVAQFPIRMPFLPGVKHGDKVNLTIRMYFGLTEIKIEAIIKDKMFVFTSAFEAGDLIAKNDPMPSSSYDQAPGTQTSILPLQAPPVTQYGTIPGQPPSMQYGGIPAQQGPPQGYGQPGGQPLAQSPSQQNYRPQASPLPSYTQSPPQAYGVPQTNPAGAQQQYNSYYGAGQQSQQQQQQQQPLQQQQQLQQQPQQQQQQQQQQYYSTPQQQYSSAPGQPAYQPGYYQGPPQQRQPSQPGPPSQRPPQQQLTTAQLQQQYAQPQRPPGGDRYEGYRRQ